MAEQALRAVRADEAADALAEPEFAFIERLFFAYRDFVGEPDRLLAVYGFGRAHHRVLHFVHRRPGLTIAALLGILQITKQSLARVLKDLMDKGFVVQRAGNQDRRQRCLHCTEQGDRLVRDLALQQSERIHRALAAAGPRNEAAILRFLDGLMDPGVRRTMAALDDWDGAP
jgi:DNA-binding MarR family transcriptional regulator